MVKDLEGVLLSRLSKVVAGSGLSTEPSGKDGGSGSVWTFHLEKEPAVSILRGQEFCFAHSFSLTLGTVFTIYYFVNK